MKKKKISFYLVWLCNPKAERKMKMAQLRWTDSQSLFDNTVSLKAAQKAEVDNKGDY